MHDADANACHPTVTINGRFLRYCRYDYEWIVRTEIVAHSFIYFATTVQKTETAKVIIKLLNFF